MQFGPICPDSDYVLTTAGGNLLLCDRLAAFVMLVSSFYLYLPFHRTASRNLAAIPLLRQLCSNSSGDLRYVYFVARRRSHDIRFLRQRPFPTITCAVQIRHQGARDQEAVEDGSYH